MDCCVCGKKATELVWCDGLSFAVCAECAKLSEDVFKKICTSK